MTFEEIVDQAIEMVRRRGQVSYQMLKRQFDLDDTSCEDLKDEILYSQSQIVDDEGRGFAWAGEPVTASEPADDERRFYALILTVIGLLQCERRVTYRRLKYVVGIDDALVEEIREELRLRRLAIDEEGKVLVWVGETQPALQPVVAMPSRPALTDALTVRPDTVLTEPAPVTESSTPSHGSTATPETISTDTPRDELATTPESTRITTEAERRQLTVMFCDLVGSTDLSGRLDPEDLREVVRAYQETAAEVIERYEGHIAQYLGDGLLIYFGFPVAHEDDAQRAVHTGLGIVEAMVSRNMRLEADYGVTLAVRIGIHTGPVVVGEMGGGGRHEWV